MSLPLLYPETLGNGCAQFISPPCCHIISHISWFFTLKLPIIELKPPAPMHHVVIIVIIVIIAVLPLCYSIIPHTILIFYCHASMLALYTSLI